MSSFLSLVVQDFDNYSQRMVDHGMQGRWSSVVSDLDALCQWYAELDDVLRDELPNRELLSRIGSLVDDLDVLVTDTLSGPHGDMDTVRESLLDDMSMLLTDIASVLDRIQVVMGDKSSPVASRRIMSSAFDRELELEVANARTDIGYLRRQLRSYSWSRFLSNLRDVEDRIDTLDSRMVPGLPVSRRPDAEERMSEARDCLARLAEIAGVPAGALGLPYEIAEFSSPRMTAELLDEAEGLIDDLEACVASLLVYSVRP